MDLVHEIFFVAKTELAYNYSINDIRFLLYKEPFWVRFDDGIEQKPEKTLTKVQEFCTKICTDLENKRLPCIDRKTYDIFFWRTVRIRDAADKINYQSHDFSGGSCSFILSTTGKLIYPSDIVPTLKVPSYFKGTTPNISQVKQDIPVYIEKYDKYHVKFRPLTAADIVVDKHLNQIWPVATQQAPVVLLELLKQTNEKLR